MTIGSGSSKAWVTDSDQFFKEYCNPGIWKVWEQYYEPILVCNTLLTYANSPEIDEMMLKNARANAHFIRGMLYFRLATIFKDIPMPLIPEVDLNISKTPYREVMEQVIKDIEFAEQWLQSPRDLDPLISDKHASTTAAKAFLAKTYMQLSGYPTYESDMWVEVKRLTKDIIDAGVYSLMDDFAACFQDPTQVNKEMIFSHIYGIDEESEVVASRFFGTYWSKQFDSYIETKFYANFPLGYRKAFSSVCEEDLVNDDPVANFYKDMVSFFEHSFVSKFSYGTIEGQPEFEHAWETSNDIPLMRMSEVYLMYAEACARFGEMGEAEKYLNFVRRRAYANGSRFQKEVQMLSFEFWKDENILVDYAIEEGDLIEAIAKERAYEFLGEPGGNYWLDLLRLEKIGEVNAYRFYGNPESSPGLETVLLNDPSDRALWWEKIPSTEIELNPNLK